MANIMKERWIRKVREYDGNDRIYKKIQRKIFQGRDSELLETDPEFMERFEHFAFSEVVNETKLDDKIGFMAVLAALLGCQGEEAFRELLSAAVNIGITPVEVKEIVYQAAAYLGMGRVLSFLKITNEVLTEKGGIPSTGRTGSQHDGEPHGDRDTGTSGDLWGRNAGFLAVRASGEQAYQSLAGRKLFW